MAKTNRQFCRGSYMGDAMLLATAVSARTANPE